MGEFTWAPEIAPAGPIMVLVSLEEQRAYVYRNGALDRNIRRLSIHPA